MWVHSSDVAHCVILKQLDQTRKDWDKESWSGGARPAATQATSLLTSTTTTTASSTRAQLQSGRPKMILVLKWYGRISSARQPVSDVDGPFSLLQPYRWNWSGIQGLPHVTSDLFNRNKS
jgi:hypothetical protein